MNSKHAFDDIIPPSKAPSQRRSIRDIPVREKKQNKIEELLEETAEIRAEHHTPPPAYTPPVRMRPINTRKKSSKLPLILLVVIVLIALGGAAMTFVFDGANVKVTIKSESIPVEVTATSTPDSSSATGTLPYKVIPVQKEASAEVTATGAPSKVEKKASGIITIVNKNTAPQQLIATTRFETSEGLVYRLDEPVTVPANGSIDAKVTADQPGDKYNVGLKDFTLPGFKGTPKFTTITARSKTTMTGGFSGMLPKVEEADLLQANKTLEKTLTEQAIAEAKRQLGKDQLIFANGGVRTTYTSSLEPGSAGKATVKGKVVAEALVYDISAIETLIANTKNGQRYRFDNLDSLAVSFNNRNPITSYIGGPVLLLKLTGTLTTGQSFDENALKGALSGKAKGQMPQILGMYPEITEGNATIRPFWSKSFPTDTNKIIIHITQ